MKNGELDLILIDPVCVIGKKQIIKASFNIIDLIEVEDLVNGREVYEIGYSKDTPPRKHILNGFCLYNDEIKTILTKEQIKANQYEVS